MKTVTAYGMWTGRLAWTSLLSLLCGFSTATAFVTPWFHTVNSWTGQQHQEPPSSVPHFRGRTAKTAMSLGDDSSFCRRSLLEGVAYTTFSASVLAALVGAGNPSPALAKGQRVKGGGPIVTLEDGAQYQEMTIGDGATPKEGDRVAIHYSLFYNGLEVESSRDSQGLAARPLGFTFGTPNGPGSVPPGLDECIKGMQVGGRRKITLPPQLAFGKNGRPPFIPGGATVLFDVSLWSVKPAGMDPNLTLPGSSLF